MIPRIELARKQLSVEDFKSLDRMLLDKPRIDTTNIMNDLFSSIIEEQKVRFAIADRKCLMLVRSLRGKGLIKGRLTPDKLSKLGYTIVYVTHTNRRYIQLTKRGNKKVVFNI